MQTKIFFFSLFLLVSCGNTAKLDTTKLESFSSITNAGTSKQSMTGTFIRADGGSITNDVIAYDKDGVGYIFSKFSSQSAKEFRDKQTAGSQLKVKFDGEISGTDIVVRSIEAQ